MKFFLLPTPLETTISYVSDINRRVLESHCILPLSLWQHANSVASWDETKEGSRIRPLNYTHHGTHRSQSQMGLMALAFASYVTVVCSQQNNLKTICETRMYARMCILENYLLHMSAVMGVETNPCPPPGLTWIAQTVHEVDINYSATREQFIAVIIVYPDFAPVAVGEFSRTFAAIDRYYSPLVRFINNGSGFHEIINRTISLIPEQINCRADRGIESLSRDVPIRQIWETPDDDFHRYLARISMKMRR